MINPYEPPRYSMSLEETDRSNSKATASLVLGLISIVAWIIPLIGFPTTITGLVLGIRGLGPRRRGKAIAGILLSVIFLVLTVLSAALGAISGRRVSTCCFGNRLMCRISQNGQVRIIDVDQVEAIESAIRSSHS